MYTCTLYMYMYIYTYGPLMTPYLIREPLPLRNGLCRTCKKADKTEITYKTKMCLWDLCCRHPRKRHRKPTSLLIKV